MRILHIVPSLDPDSGGPARSVPALCRAEQAAGADVRLMAMRRRNARPTVLDGQEPYVVEWGHPWGPTRQFPTPAFWRRLREELPHFDIAHLHSLWNPLISLAAMACRRQNVPYLLSPRGMLQESAAQRRGAAKRLAYRLWERRTIQGAEALHFLTEAEADSSSSLVGGRAAVVVPNGIDPALGDSAKQGQLRRRRPALRGRRIVLFLGRLHWTKGLDVQVEALAILAKRNPEVLWLVVGPDDGERPRLSARLAQLGLEKHVLWLGLLGGEERLEALADADVFWLTSRAGFEGHSMAMNEALALGIPVVLTDTVRFNAVQEYGAGYVVPWDPEEVARATARILDDPAGAARMRERARALAREVLAWPRIAERMIGVYERVIGAPGSGSGLHAGRPGGG